MEFKSKSEIQKAIKNLITTSKKHAVKAMFRIYEYQTSEEQVNGSVYENNGVGFAGTDSGILTSFCQQYLAKGYLSEKQYAILFKKIGKYAGQLTRLAIEKGLYSKDGKNWIIAVK